MTKRSRGLRPQQERFFDFLSKHETGDVVTTQQVLAATEWEPATLDTYLRKHKLDLFLAKVGDSDFRVLQDGQGLSKDDIARAFTQVSPGQLKLAKGTQLSGENASYTLRKFVGQGAVAHVWEAEVDGGSNVVAVKVMNPRPDLLDPILLPNVQQRFRRESRNGMKVSHPRVVPYRDVGELSEHPFVVMDLADGTLASMLRQGPLSTSDSLDVVLACLDAQEHLHGVGCVHRDVKPANILWFRSSGFCLGDLGIVLWSDMNPAFTSAGTITRTSLQLGSWHYMAPEQRRSPHDAVAASDVYALGVTWYEVLTGRLLDPAEIAAKQYPPASPEPAVNAFIARMLEFAPGNRPPVAELRRELRSLQQTLGPSQVAFSFA